MFKTKILLKEFKDHPRGWAQMTPYQEDEVWDMILENIPKGYTLAHHIVSSEWDPGETVVWSPMDIQNGSSIIVERGTLRYWLSIYYE